MIDIKIDSKIIYESILFFFKNKMIEFLTVLVGIIFAIYYYKDCCGKRRESYENRESL